LKKPCTFITKALNIIWDCNLLAMKTIKSSLRRFRVLMLLHSPFNIVRFTALASCFLIFTVPFACSSHKNGNERDFQDAFDAGESRSSILDNYTLDAVEGHQESESKEYFPSEVPEESVSEYPYPIPEIQEPLPFGFGIAKALLPLPLGINTAGFGGQSGEKSRFTVTQPATKTVYMPPEVRVIFMEGGYGRLVIARLDVVGITSPFRAEVVKKLFRLTGHDFTDELILSATHTHSGPGRMVQGFFEFLADQFFPELFDKVTSAVAMAVVEAYLNMERGSMGYALAKDDLLHKDRRCENPPFSIPDMPVLAFKSKEGGLRALVVNYPIHGTVIPWTEHYLSKDVSGAIEQKIEETFDHPVMVMFLNSYAGDMAPGVTLPPELEEKDVTTVCEGLGNRAASTVRDAMAHVEYEEEVQISAKSMWVPLDRVSIGYEGDEFPYECGAVLCGASIKAPCFEDASGPIVDLDKTCVGLCEALGMPGPEGTLITVGKIGKVAFTTFPSEAVSMIGAEVCKVLGEVSGLGCLFVGYSQDYIGYSLPYDDFFYGGYEPQLCLFGPRQGEYLISKIKELAEVVFNGMEKPESGGGALSPPALSYEPLQAEIGLECGKITKDTQALFGAFDTVVFAFYGGDPWLGTPVATLEVFDGSEFSPARRRNGTVIDSTGYEFLVTLDVDPPYKQSARERHFNWRFSFKVSREADLEPKMSEGVYRLRVTGRNANDKGVSQFTVFSSPFKIEF